MRWSVDHNFDGDDLGMVVLLPDITATFFGDRWHGARSNMLDIRACEGMVNCAVICDLEREENSPAAPRRIGRAQRVVDLVVDTPRIGSGGSRWQISYNSTRKSRVNFSTA